MEPLFTCIWGNGQVWDYYEDVYGRVRPFAKLLYGPRDEEELWPVSMGKQDETWP